MAWEPSGFQFVSKSEQALRLLAIFTLYADWMRISTFVAKIVGRLRGKSVLKQVCEMIRYCIILTDTFKEKISNPVSQGQSILMELPTEVRCHIYNAVLGLPASDHIAFLCACKQIYVECHHFLFKRPLSCQSQAELQMFTGKYSSELLSNVTALDLRLEEVDVVYMQPFLSRLVQGLPARKYGHHPNVQEVQRIISSLGRLPNVQELKILPPTDPAKNSAPKMVVTQVLNWGSNHYQNLKSLSLAVENMPLSCLNSMVNLHTLRFSGYSQTCPEDAMRVLAHAKSIRELVVIGPPRTYRWQQLAGQSHGIKQTITAEVIRQMIPLESLTLCELFDSSSEPAFFTKSMFAALFERHRESLRALHLASNATPDSTIHALIAGLLTSTPNLEDLTIGWAELPPNLIDSIPTSTRRLTLAVRSRTHADETLIGLMQIRHQLPHLTHIKLDLIDEAPANAAQKGRESLDPPRPPSTIPM